MSLDLTRFHESFFTESLEGLDATEAHLLALERGGDRDGEAPADFDERLNAVFRGFHSIKGAAGSLGFAAISDFTHHVEEFLDHWRKGTAAVDRAGLDTILACIDHARLLLRSAKEGTTEGAQRSAQLARALAKLGRARPPRAKRANPPGETQGTYHIRFKPGAESFRRGNDPLRLLRVLAEMGTLAVKADLSQLPAADALDAEACHLAWNLELVTAKSAEQVEDVFAWVRDEGEVVIEVVGRRGGRERRRVDRRQNERRMGPRRSEEPPVADEMRTDRLHVSRDKIDEMMNLVGELVITKTMMKQAALSLDAQATPRPEGVLA